MGAKHLLLILFIMFATATFTSRSQAQSYTDLLPLNDPEMYVTSVPEEKKSKSSRQESTQEPLSPPTHRSQPERPAIVNALALLVYLASGAGHLGLIRSTVKCYEHHGTPVNTASCSSD